VTVPKAKHSIIVAAEDHGARFFLGRDEENFIRFVQRNRLMNILALLNFFLSGVAIGVVITYWLMF